MKIKVAPGALDKIPEEEREGVLDHIRKLIEADGIEAFRAASRPVEPIGKNEPCPGCGGELVDPHVVKLDGGLIEFVDCLECDRSFSREATN